MPTNKQDQNSTHTIQLAAFWAETRCTRPQYILLAFATLCLIVSPIQECAAQDAVLTGNWKYKSEKKIESARLAAIDEATEGLNFLLRGRARDMLQEKTKPQKTLEITDEGHQVAIEAEKRRIIFRPDGSPVQVKNQGETATIRARRKDGKLTVETQGKNGVQTIVYEMSADGTQLFIETTIVVAKTGNPVRYKTTYDRTN